MTRKSLFFIVGAGLGLAIIVATVLILRARNVEPAETLTIPSRSPTASSAPSPTGGLTKEEQAVKDEVGRLEQALPKDISQTWTPEFRKLMEDRKAAVSSAPATTPTSVTP